MIQLLMLGRDYGYDRLRAAVEAALELGCSDSAAILYLLTADGLERVRPEAIDIGTLARYERPLPVLADYNQLLSAEVVQ